MTKETPAIDFSLILASSVHDMKNSLNMLMNSLDEITMELEGQNHPAKGRLTMLQYEAARVNNDLVQLLSLYKLEQNLLSAQIDEHQLQDFLEEVMARFLPLFEGRNIHCELDCTADLFGYFDRELITGVMTNVLANSIRYARNRLRISAEAVGENGLQISVEDDGPGYPQKMLELDGPLQTSSDFLSGSTHLGLYFARQIARLHRQDGREGTIRLSNGGALGGGIFSLILP